MEKLKEFKAIFFLFSTLAVLAICVLWHYEKGEWLKRVRKWSVICVKRLFFWTLCVLNTIICSVAISALICMNRFITLNMKEMLMSKVNRLCGGKCDNVACSKPFTGTTRVITDSQVGSHNVNFCSSECYLKWLRENKQL